jgi:large subunit ribosomal protein L13
MKTHSVKAGDIKETWYIVDASDKPVGRLATAVARVLRGKHRPDFSPHLDLGDHVIVINVDKIHLSGKKREQKIYYSWSGYPSGLKIRGVGDILKKDPTGVLRRAVRGMLPPNRLRTRYLRKLKMYVGPEHPHAAQKPQDFGALYDA